MKKNKLILLQLFIAFVLICTSVYATVNATIDVKTSSTTIEAGKEVSVTLSLKNVDKKVTNIEGYINYNKDVLEKLTIDSIQKNEDGTVKIGDETLKVEDVTTGVSGSDSGISFNGDPSSNNDSKIVIDFKNGITSDTDLLTINFKVKSTAKLGDIEKAISYSMFVITVGDEESEEITKDISLTIKEASKPTEPDDDPKDDDNKGDDNKDDNKGDNNQDNDNKGDNNNNNDDNKNDNKDDKNKDKNNVNNNTNTNKVNNTNTNRNTNKVNNTNTNTKDNTVAGTTIPAAGAKLIVIPAIVLIVLAYLTYNKYRDMKDI